MKKLVILFLVFIPQFISAQCAMCKAVVESGEPELAEGINSGIMYLMIFPYLLVGILFYYIYKHKKKIKI